MKTLEEAVEAPGVSKFEGVGEGLNLHFSPIPNWYRAMGTNCPICDNPVTWDWQWQSPKPVVTTEITPRFCTPVTTGCKLLKYGHRWITVECNTCHTMLCAENLDP